MEPAARLYPNGVQRCVVGVACLAVGIGFVSSKVLDGDAVGILAGVALLVCTVPIGLDLLWSHVVVAGDALVLVRLFRKRTITVDGVVRVEHAMTARRKIRVQITTDDGRSFEMDSCFSGRTRGTRRFYRRLIEVAPRWRRHVGDLAGLPRG